MHVEILLQEPDELLPPVKGVDAAEGDEHQLRRRLAMTLENGLQRLLRVELPADEKDVPLSPEFRRSGALEGAVDQCVQFLSVNNHVTLTP